MPPGIQIGMPARGSLAYLRMHHAATPGLKFAAIYLAFPLHDHPARRAFFEPALALASPTPSVADLIRALRNHGGAASQMLDTVCSTLATIDFCIAWSKHMVEVHDSYSAVSHGYREVGLLREHTDTSQVLVQRANHNDASRITFRLHNVTSETPLFVLYIYPVIPAAVMGIEPLSQAVPPVLAGRSQSHTPAYTGRSQSRTPAPTTISTPSFTFVLASVLRTSLALDRHFLEDGFQLASLLDRDYGTAYLQIRQALVIESVLRRSASAISQLKVHDVAAWAGINPATYSNNRTFAKEARATLLLLRSRGPAQKDINLGLDESLLPVMNMSELAVPSDDVFYEFGQRTLIVLQDYVFDVTVVKSFSGPNGAFMSYSSKDISYALTRSSTLKEDVDVVGYGNLSTAELEVLDNWLSLFLCG
ncbi:hypothetical protein B0H19DRAFT_1275906 [Mycena capillaripes]|nr:hypothetical protein B0H19DRAFT_1275906 [Mycena capillaripes]